MINYVLSKNCCLPFVITFVVVVVVDVDVDVDVVVVEVVVDVVVVVVEGVDLEVSIVEDVVDVCISSSPERHVVAMSSSRTKPPPAVLTSHPLHCDRGHRTYLSCSLTRSPL